MVFHAVTALRVCLQQVKAAVEGGGNERAAREFEAAVEQWAGAVGTVQGQGTSMHTGGASPPLATGMACVRPYRAPSDAAVQGALEVVWAHWEDPLVQTARQAHAVFDILMDVVAAREQRGGGRGRGRGKESESGELGDCSPVALNQQGTVSGCVDSTVEGEEGQSISAVAAYTGWDCGNGSSNSSNGHNRSSSSSSRSNTGSGGAGGVHKFMQALAEQVLRVPWHCKGKYGPLASLTTRMGAKRLLEMSTRVAGGGEVGGEGVTGKAADAMDLSWQPGPLGDGNASRFAQQSAFDCVDGGTYVPANGGPRLLEQAVTAMRDEGLCCAISNFLHTFLTRLREECWRSADVQVPQLEPSGTRGGEEEEEEEVEEEVEAEAPQQWQEAEPNGDVAWRMHWLPAVLRGLTSASSVHRSNVATYALPVVLVMDPPSLGPVLAFLLPATVPPPPPLGRAQPLPPTEQPLPPVSLPGEEALAQLPQAHLPWPDLASLRVQGSEGAGGTEDGWRSQWWEGEDWMERRLGGLVAVLKAGRTLGILDTPTDALRLAGRGRERPDRSEGEKENGRGEEEVEESSGEDGASDVAALRAVVVSGDGANAVGPGDAKESSSSALAPHAAFFHVLCDALWHADASVRVDLAEMLCCSFRTTAMPTALELSLMAVAFPLGLRGAAPAVRMRWRAAARRLLARARAALERSCRQERSAGGGREGLGGHKWVEEEGGGLPVIEARNAGGGGERSEGVEGRGGQNAVQQSGSKSGAKTADVERRKLLRRLGVANATSTAAAAAASGGGNLPPAARRALAQACTHANGTGEPRPSCESAEVTPAMTCSKLLGCLACDQQPSASPAWHAAPLAMAPPCPGSSSSSSAGRSDMDSPASASATASFLHWLLHRLLSSLYPSAPYERKSVALDTLLTFFSVWPPPALPPPCPPHPPSAPAAPLLSPWTPALLSPPITSLLLSAAVDSWDRLREASLAVLSAFPSPLPGLRSPPHLLPLISLAVSLAASPRVRESDAGALLLRLLFSKYVVALGWQVSFLVREEGEGEGEGDGEVQGGIGRGEQQAVAQGMVVDHGFSHVSAEPGSTARGAECTHGSPVEAGAVSGRMHAGAVQLQVAVQAAAGRRLEGEEGSVGVIAGGTGGAAMHSVSYLSSLIDWLEACVREGERDLVAACRHSLAHGALLVIRYTLEEMDWKVVAHTPSTGEHDQASLPLCAYVALRQQLQRLCSLLLQVTGIALWVVAADGLRVAVRGRGGEGGSDGEEEEKDDERQEEGGGKEMEQEGREGGVEELAGGTDDVADGARKREYGTVGGGGGRDAPLEEEGAETMGDSEEAEGEEGEEEGAFSGLAPLEQMVMVACWLTMKEVR